LARWVTAMMPSPASATGAAAFRSAAHASVASPRPQALGQLLIYPATDFSTRRRSFTENGEGYMLTASSIEWFEGHYAPDRTDWRASPMLAPSHRGVAPAIVFTCEYDPLRDEENDYAAKLATAGVTVIQTCYPGLIHGAFSMTAVIPSAKAMMDDACTHLRAALARRPN
jgi:acetyl esterase